MFMALATFIGVVDSLLMPEDFTGVLGVDVVIHPVVEKIDLGCDVLMLEGVTELKVIGGFHLEVGVTDFKRARRVVNTIDIELLCLGAPLRLCECKAQAVDGINFPETRNRTAHGKETSGCIPTGLGRRYKLRFNSETKVIDNGICCQSFDAKEAIICDGGVREFRTV